MIWVRGLEDLGNENKSLAVKVEWEGGSEST